MPQASIVPVVAVRGHHLIAVDAVRLQPDNHGFLADIQVTEPADQPHAV
jgi:hypothetical protein